MRVTRNGSREQEAAAVQVPPLNKMNAAQLNAARAHLDKLWRKIERGTVWERFALEDYSDAPHFENEERQQHLFTLSRPQRIELPEQIRLRLQNGVPVKPDRKEAKLFLSILDPTTDKFTFQTFDDVIVRREARKQRLAEDNEKRKAKGQKPRKLHDPFAHIIHGTLDQRWKELCRHNADGAGIYITINATDFKGRSNENIVRLRARFVDLDGAPIQPLLNYEPAPHIVVESSPGRAQGFWITADDHVPNTKQFKKQQTALAERFGGDTSVDDLPRVMRLPGFFHRKATPFRSRIISHKQAPPYKIAALALAPEATITAEQDAESKRFSDFGNESKSATGKLNDAAIANYAAWVPEIFPSAAANKAGDGYRVTSADLGRENEEDLSFHATGIKDFGVHDLDDPREGKRTPVEIVMEHVFEVPVDEIAARTNTTEFQQACDWLRERVGDGNGDGDGDADAGAKQGKKQQFKIVAEAHTFPDEASLPRYAWLYGRHLLRGTVAGTAAMGGTGKSSDSIVEAMAMASGKKLLHDDVPIEPLRVVLINLEDDRNTMDKRIAAAMRHHGLTKEDIGDRLIVLAKKEIKIKVAKQGRNGVERNEQIITALTEFMIEKQADVLSIDSFIRTHNVPENDNSAIEEVVECFEAIATAANCAVHLWHHTRKGDGGEATVELARGAKAFIDACRSVRILETMSAKEAEKAEVENHWQYFRSFSGKRNFAPSIQTSTWFHITGVVLMNGPINFTAEGDNIGVVETWSLPVANITPEDAENIRKAVADGSWRENAQAGMWAGKAVAKVLGLDPADDKEKIKRTIKKLIKDGVLMEAPGEKADRKPCLYIVPGDGVPVGGGKKPTLTVVKNSDETPK